MTAPWFPRPASPASIRFADTTSDQAAPIFAALQRADAEEWTHKVGVVSPQDGSAKSSTRLLRAGGWVYKLDLARSIGDAHEALTELRRQHELTRRVPLWHPAKVWFTYSGPTGHLLVSGCPLLRTIRALSAAEDRLRAWQRALTLAVTMTVRHRIGLDLNPANFGFSPEGRLYYLDDEIYPPLGPDDLAQGIVARLPEEPEVDESTWRRYGEAMQELMAPLCTTPAASRACLAAATEYPLTPRFSGPRDALVEGLRRHHPHFRPRSRSRNPERVCVFADVHGNAPALEAVLSRAVELGVDRYLHLGDVVGYGPFPRECIAALADLDGAILLRGNHDQAVSDDDDPKGMNRHARAVVHWTRDILDDEERRWLGALPREHRGSAWLAVHGAPMDPYRFHAYVYEMTFEQNLKCLEAEDLRLCFHGHTHVQLVYGRRPDGSLFRLSPELDQGMTLPGTLLVNPGSVGQPRDGDARAAFALWERPTNRLTFLRVPYPIADTIGALERAAFPEDLARRLELAR